MPAKDLGTKHNCFKCGAKFYDLKKPQAICPKCGANQRDAPVQKAPPPEKRAKAPLPDPEPQLEEAEEGEEALESLEEEASEDEEP